MTILYFILLFLHVSPPYLSIFSSSPERRSVNKPLTENTINTIDRSLASLQHVGGKRFMALQENVCRVNELESRVKFNCVGRTSVKEVSSNPEEVFNTLAMEINYYFSYRWFKDVERCLVGFLTD